MNNTVIIHTDRYRNWVFDPDHPTQGRRFINGFNAITDNHPDITVIPPRAATRAELSTVHTATYLSQVQHSWVCGEWAGTRPDMAALASLFVGGTLVALDQLMSGEATTAIHLPGAKHHAQADRSSGFCVFADFAIAAHLARRAGRRVAILDIDAHHGDGTENLTYDDPGILTFSVHEDGIFPGTGYDDDPEQSVWNVPLGEESGDEWLTWAVERFISKAADHDADLIFVAAGADGHETDPLSSLRYTLDGFHNAMRGLRLAFSRTPILMGGAGGYQPDSFTPLAWASSAEGLMVLDSAKAPH